MAFIIDPNLTSEDLSKCIGYFSEKPEEEVIVFFAPDQKRYIEKFTDNPVKYIGSNWSIPERMKCFNLYPYFDEIERGEEAIIKQWPGLFSYSLNVAKLYRYFLATKNILFWIVLITLHKYKNIIRSNHIIALGSSSVFFAAIDSFVRGVPGLDWTPVHVFNKKGRSLTDRYRNALKNYITDLQSLNIPKRKLLYIEKHRQTLPLFPYLKKQSDFTLITQSYPNILMKMCDWTKNALICEAVEKIERRMMGMVSRHGLNLKDLPSHEIFVSFIHYLRVELEKYIKEIYCVWKSLDYLKPHAALCINWFGIRQQAIREWCRGNNRLFISLQHGFYSGGVVSAPERKIDADIFLCWGPEMKKSFIAADHENEPKIRTTGNPVYDEQKNKNDYLSPSPSKHHSVLVALSDMTYSARDVQDIIWSEIEEAMAKFPTLSWKIRTHDLDSRNGEMKSRFDNRAEFNNADNIFDALQPCDLVISNVSTVPLDAMIKGKPVVIFNMLGQPERFTEFGAGIVINKKGHLCVEIKRLIKVNFKDEALMIRQNNFVNAFTCPNSITNVLDTLNQCIDT